MFQGDLFSGLNDGLLSRAEALAAVDIGKHSASSTPTLPTLKHDMMYHSMNGSHGAPNGRPHHQVRFLSRNQIHSITYEVLQKVNILIEIKIEFEVE